MRLELLEPEQNEPLIRALCGLLMLLPQSDTFQMLQRRLTAIPSSAMHLHSPQKAPVLAKSVSKRDKINFTELFAHFENVQQQHREQKRKEQKDLLVSDMNILTLEE